MNKTELGSRLVDFVLGKKVEGRVAAILPPVSPNHHRIVVDTGVEVLEVEYPRIRTYTTVTPIPMLPEPAPVRNEYFSSRGVICRPWVDGQIL